MIILKTKNFSKKKSAPWKGGAEGNWSTYNPNKPTKGQLRDLRELDSDEFDKDIRDATNTISNVVGIMGGIAGAPVGMAVGAIKKKPLLKSAGVGALTGYLVGNAGVRLGMRKFRKLARKEGKSAKEKLEEIQENQTNRKSHR